MHSSLFQLTCLSAGRATATSTPIVSILGSVLHSAERDHTFEKKVRMISVPKVKKKENSESSLQFKLLALLIFAVLTIAFAYAVKTRKTEVQKPKPIPDEQVLGGEIHKTPVEDFQNLSSTVQTGLDQAKEAAQDGLESVLGAATESATRFVLENTAGSIATQINKLPENQKEELKQQICK